ncbi:MAG: hypothetical protein AAFZ17_02610 [Cyanobacteria bacterium J06650_10]
MNRWSCCLRKRLRTLSSCWPWSSNGLGCVTVSAALTVVQIGFLGNAGAPAFTRRDGLACALAFSVLAYAFSR